MEHTPLSTELAKAAPPVGFLASVLAGVQWGQLASFLACIYTVGLIIQQGYRLWRWNVLRKSKKYDY